MITTANIGAAPTAGARIAIDLPASVRRLVDRLQTTSARRVTGATGLTSYGCPQYRAAGAMLLSDRIAATQDGTANKIDINKLCKDSGFDAKFVDRAARFLVAAGVLKVDDGRFRAGPQHTAFWGGERDAINAAARSGYQRLAVDLARVSRYSSLAAVSLPDLLQLFFHCFDGLALQRSALHVAMEAFVRLPDADLATLVRRLGIAFDVTDRNWRHWFYSEQRPALLDAQTISGWAYTIGQSSDELIALSPVGQEILGIRPALPMPPLATTLAVQSNLSIFAGAGLPIESLAIFFRCCKAQRIDHLIEFRFDRQLLLELPATEPPAQDLRQLLAGIPLPSTVAAMLATQSALGGPLGVSHCSAVVQTPSTDAAAAISCHPKLKSLVHAGGPPGWLLLKSNANPDLFVRRCRELGFEVTTL